MRLLYPWLAVATYLFFLAALAAGTALVAAVPVAVGLLAVALVAAGQIVAFVRLLRAFFVLTFGALAMVVRMLRDLFAAVFGGEPEPTGALGSYGREALPELFRLADEVAAALRTRGLDRIYVTHDGSCAVTERRRPGVWPRRRLRVLVLGLPFAYAMSLDELRTVLGHELAHLSMGMRWCRVTWRFGARIEEQLWRMRESGWRAINPMYWAVRLSYEVLVAVHLRWSRADELAADRRSARVLGANHFAAALRKVRDVIPALELAVEVIAPWCASRRVAPLHLGEAAYRFAGAMPPRLRKRLSQGADGDVRDLEGRTHPPIALRIAAVHRFPARPAKHGELAVRYLPDLRNLEAHLTRVALRIAEQRPTREVVEQVLAETEWKAEPA